MGTVVYPREIEASELTSAQKGKLYAFTQCTTSFTKKKLKVLLDEPAMGMIFRAYLRSGRM